MEFGDECLRVLLLAQRILPSFTFIPCYPESLTYYCLHPRHMAGVFTPDIPSHAAQRGWREAASTFSHPGCLSPQGDVGLDWGLLILDHPAGKLLAIQSDLCLQGVFQRVGPVWASDDLRGIHGLCFMLVLHPGDVQVGMVEVAHMGTATMEYSTEIPLKTKNRTTILSISLTPGHYLERTIL